MTTKTSPPSSSPLLALPMELRHQIFSYLLTPSTPSLLIRSLFIRTYYRNIFMSQQRKDISTALLTVCRQITTEALPILYSTPLWRCGCRFENLASQIGMHNFNLVRRMHIDADDLPLVAQSLGPERPTRSAHHHHEAVIPRLRFTALEMLLVEGYQAVAVTSAGDRRVREEALRLCRLAREIVRGQGRLRVLVQRDQRGNGGADALDLTMGRVRWRFLRCAGDVLSGEHVVDLDAVVEVFEELVELDRKEGVGRKSSLPTGWTDTGVFEQYPYLPGRAAGLVLPVHDDQQQQQQQLA